MSTQQPEALRIADELEASSHFPGNLRSCNNAGAAELRRLHARVQELDDACRMNGENYEFQRLKADHATAAVYKFHYAMKDAGWHPGRTDDDLTQIIREKARELEELRAQLAAIGAGGVEPLRKRECLHQIAEPVACGADDQIKIPRSLLERLAPEAPMNQDEMGGCVWCAGTPPGERYGYAASDPSHHDPDCAWLQARAALASTAAQPYSIDVDPQGIRARVAEAITGALAFGAQGNNPPPTGHWLAQFWGSARAERAAAQPPAGWVMVEERLPKPGTAVLLDIGKQTPIRAMWAAKHTVEAHDEADPDWCDYDESTETYYCPEGWYEWNEHEEVHWAVSATPRAWMHLPPAPKE